MVGSRNAKEITGEITPEIIAEQQRHWDRLDELQKKVVDEMSRMEENQRRFEELQKLADERSGLTREERIARLDTLKDQYLSTKKEEGSIEFGVTSHYNQYDGFEVVEVCEQLRAPDGTGGFNRGNAFKYLARAGWKSADKHVEDLEKAKNYIQREIDRLKSL
jgi:peptidoglycan hydrolase CwlO-like protein